MSFRIALFAMLGILNVASEVSAGSWVFVTLLEERQIVTFEQDPATGELEQVAVTDCPAEPACMAVSPDRKTLFVSLRSSGELASFRIEPETDALTLLSVVEGGADPAYLLPDENGRFLITAYYASNCVTVHALDSDGVIHSEVLQVIPTAEKAHGLAFNGDQSSLFVTHTGANRIYHFHFDAESGELTAADPPFAATPGKTIPVTSPCILATAGLMSATRPATVSASSRFVVPPIRSNAFKPSARSRTNSTARRTQRPVARCRRMAASSMSPIAATTASPVSQSIRRRDS